MRRYCCPSCQSEVFFDNTACLTCGTALAFAPGGGFVPLAGVTPCPNRDAIACNWVAEGGGLCLSCRATTTLPDLSVPGHAERWARLEAAKRPVIRSLHRLGLPLADAAGQPAPRFAFLADPPGAGPRVLTGHEAGLITLNIAEADDAARAEMRAAMHEPYRTLAGHVRHETGHHFWSVLTQDQPERLAALRALFGDERQDYSAALAAHYRDGPPADWAQTHISAYASAHPAEDFAETWAHVLHLLDGLETARAFGLVDPTLPGELPALALLPMARLAPVWIGLSVALNAVNRSMGHDTFYPFVLTPAVIAKLESVRALMTGSTSVDPLGQGEKWCR